MNPQILGFSLWKLAWRQWDWNDMLSTSLIKFIHFFCLYDLTFFWIKSLFSAWLFMFHLRKGNKVYFDFCKNGKWIACSKSLYVCNMFHIAHFCNLGNETCHFKDFFPQFCDVCGLFTKRLNQIWLEVREKSKFFSNPTLH
jgi:hypothetical protein